MIRALVAASFALLALVSPARADDAGCFKDTDCKGSRICVERACVDAPAVQGCARDTDCPGDDVCEQKICVPPAPVKKSKAKPGKRDLVKEAQQKAAAHKAAQTAQPAPPPEPVIAPAPEPTQPPVAPPQLIQAAPPPPVRVEPVAPPPAPEPVQAAAPAPASSSPPPPPDLIFAPPPPLVAAAPPPANAPSSNEMQSIDTSNDSSPIVFGVALTAGLSFLSSGNSETDLGVDLNGDFGFRISDHLAIELMVQGSVSPLLSSDDGTAGSVSHTALGAAIGLGMRIDHMGAFPGHFLVGPMGSYVGISSSDTTPTINLGGPALVAQYGVPVFGMLEAQGQLGLHLLNNGFTLFAVTVGVAFGN